MVWLHSIDSSLRILTTLLLLLWTALRKGTFDLFKSTHNSSKTLKTKIFEALVLALPDFDKIFEVECDASRLGISVVLIQNKRQLLTLVRS